MSLSNLISDIFSGNFKSAESRIQDWWTSLSPGIQKFVQTIETNEGKILQGLVVTAAQDVISGGLTTASFVAAAKDVAAKLEAQNIAMAQTTIFAALNAEVGSAGK
jgi:hypothetical protein